MAVEIHIEGVIELVNRNPYDRFINALQQVFSGDLVRIYVGYFMALQTMEEQAREMVSEEGLETGMKTGILIK